ncbi:hypothetical protein [Sandarakinorhabdus sp.]|uniref:hypothetical protein n=1 Tax=Sandarakinorhabdus sp. TaxID=1916663 RepID=UPI003340517B
MWQRLLPASASADFTGRPLALWALYPVTAITLWRSQHHMFAPDGGAESIATIPLSRYSPDASANIIAMFAQWGLSQLLLGLVMLVVAVRYRALVPLMWLLLCLEYAGRQGLGLIKPVHTAGTAPGAAANPLLLLLAVVMLALALWPAQSRSR